MPLELQPQNKGVDPNDPRTFQMCPICKRRVPYVVASSSCPDCAATFYAGPGVDWQELIERLARVSVN